MPFAEWSDEFSIGVEEIDREHKQLFALLNALHDTVDAGCAHEKIKMALDDLRRYGTYHFSHEEELFLSTDYPNAERHRGQHRALAITVNEICEDFELGGSAALPRQVLDFLKNWLLDHFMGPDRTFGRHFNSCRTPPGHQAPSAAEGARW
jgi:hemerythrin